uniref:FRIGIDA-like protein n=1 Tax=Noccaea caerulescens TaxID=107243 RepID=A0A1J3JZF9_NOCCA
MTVPESIAAAINQIDEKKEKLKKAFDELETHRSLLSPSFNLSWSEIDSHFSSLQSSLSNRLRLLQSAAPIPDSEKIEASTTEAPLLWPELRTFCENMDGKGLGKYMIDNSRKRMSINHELPAAIRFSANPAALVLDAIEGSYHCSPSARAIDGRWIFVLLLEALIEVNPKLTNDLRERARTLAYDWKLNIGNKPSEALGFLHLVSVFELASLFKISELVDYVFLISKYKHATTICKKIGLDKRRIGDLIEKFLATGRLLVAIRFIYEFEMDDRFRPVNILKLSLKNSREAAKRICAEKNNSVKAQNEATEKELSALRAVIKVVKEKNIEYEFLDEELEECVQKLENQKAQAQAQKKRAANNVQQPKQQLDKKRPRVANGAASDYSLTIPPLSQQQPLLPNPSHSLQVNSFGLLPNPSHCLPGVAVPMPYGNPLALYGSVPAQSPALASPPVYYEQQPGYGGYALPSQYHPHYYPQ